MAILTKTGELHVDPDKRPYRTSEFDAILNVR